MVVDTSGGCIHVKWDTSASASPVAQLAFFAELLAVLGIFEDFVNTCPLNYSSPNASGIRDVPGTWPLVILAGHKRYAQITGLRGDAGQTAIAGHAQDHQ